MESHMIFLYSLFSLFLKTKNSKSVTKQPLIFLSFESGDKIGRSCLLLLLVEYVLQQF